MIKAALIDLDGTILDSMGMWETLGEDILTSLGFKSEVDINKLFKSFTIREAAEYYYDHFPTGMTVTELEKLINKTIEEAYLNELPLKEGAENLLKVLKKNEIALALVTITSSFLAKKALERLDVLDDFDIILSCDDLNCSKNDSTIYDRALEELGVTKEEALVFEDAFHAVKTAKENNYLTIGVYDSNVLEQDIIQDTADYYLKSFNEVEELMENLKEEEI